MTGPANRPWRGGSALWGRPRAPIAAGIAAESSALVPVDPYLGDPTAAAIVVDLDAGRWQPVAQHLSATEPALRHWYLTVAAKEVRTWPQAWAEDSPGSALAWGALGLRTVQRAWNARTGGRAESVSREQWDAFAALLRTAKDQLTYAAELDDTDATPFVGLLDVALGLGEPVADRESLVDEAIRRAPDSPWPYWRGAFALTAKWDGTHEAMFAAARRGLAAPDGSLAATAVASAHIERWLHLSLFDPAENGKDQAKAYFARLDVARELRDVAQRTVLSPRCAPGPLRAQAAHLLAFAFDGGGDDHAAVAMLSITGRVPASWPWQYRVGGAAEAFRRVYDRRMSGLPPAVR